MNQSFGFRSEEVPKRQKFSWRRREQIVNVAVGSSGTKVF
jgi:hypothetical protein